jgi:hypothetical protein
MEKVPLEEGGSNPNQLVGTIGRVDRYSGFEWWLGDRMDGDRLRAVEEAQKTSAKKSRWQ